MSILRRVAPGRACPAQAEQNKCAKSSTKRQHRWYWRLVLATAIALPWSLMALPGYAILTELLEFGSEGPQVTALQRRLNELGYVTPVDGVFGARTVASVQAYQAACGLAIDGVVGSDTRKSLNDGRTCGGGTEQPIGTPGFPSFPNDVPNNGGGNISNMGQRWVVMIPSDDPVTLRRLRQLPWYFQNLRGQRQLVPKDQFTIDARSSRFGPFIRLASYNPQDKYQAEELYRYLQRMGFKDAQMRYEPRL